MGEFYEQFLTQDYGNKQKQVNGLAKLLLILGAVSFAFNEVTVTIIFVVGYFVINIISRKLFLEYEYELTEDELVITKIMNKSRRKILAKVNVNNVDKVYKVEDEYRKDENKIIHACFENNKLNEQIIFVKTDSQVKVIRVAMDKKLISMCRRINPRIFNVI